MANKTTAQTNTRGPIKQRGLRFRLVHVLYVTAMLASALATFGPIGLMPGLLIIVAWTFVFLSESRPKAFGIVIVILCSCWLFGLLAPMLQSSREAARRNTCSDNLKQIALALHHYYDLYKSFPPAYVAGPDGKPMHSWRVLILPFVENKRLYDLYNFDEPWDGPNNRKLAAKMPNLYACPSRPRTDIHTTYVAVVGPRAAWAGADTRNVDDFVDGTAYTVHIMEGEPRGVPWMQPRDLSYAEALQLMQNTPQHIDEAGGHQKENFFYVKHLGRNVALADASTRFIHHGMSTDAWAAMLRLDDGKGFINGEIDVPRSRIWRLKYGNCFRFALFVVLAIFPLPWVWLHPHGDTDQPKLGRVRA